MCTGRFDAGGNADPNPDRWLSQLCIAKTPSAALWTGNQCQGFSDSSRSLSSGTVGANTLHVPLTTRANLTAQAVRLP